MRLEPTSLPAAIRQDLPARRCCAARTPSREPPRILLLTSGLGLGHVRAAQAIDAALRGAAHVRTVDFWSLMNPGVAAAMHETYLSLVQNHSHLYERLYQLDEHTWRQILESEAGPPRAVLEVLELISGIAGGSGRTCAARRTLRVRPDAAFAAVRGAALDRDSLAGNGVRARLALMKWTWLRLIRRLEPAESNASRLTSSSARR